MLGRGFDILCFPHAGGSSYFYNLWRKFLPEGVDLKTIDLPGHGRKAGTPFQTSADSAVQLILQELEIRRPYVVFGHSMGSHLAYRVLSGLPQEQRDLCMRLVVSASKGPNLVREHGYPIRSNGTRQQIIEYLQSHGEVSQELLENDTFMNYLIDMMRADFKICESLSTFATVPVLNNEVLVLGGQDDKVTQAELRDWLQVSRLPGRVHQFPGGHFYFVSKEQDVLAMILR